MWLEGAATGAGMGRSIQGQQETRKWCVMSSCTEAYKHVGAEQSVNLLELFPNDKKSYLGENGKSEKDGFAPLLKHTTVNKKVTICAIATKAHA